AVPPPRARPFSLSPPRLTGPTRPSGPPRRGPARPGTPPRRPRGAQLDPATRRAGEADEHAADLLGGNGRSGTPGTDVQPSRARTVRCPATRPSPRPSASTHTRHAETGRAL